MRFPFRVCIPRPTLGLEPSRLPPRLQLVMMKFPLHISHIVLLWFRVIMVMLRFLSCAQVCIAFPPLLFFDLNLPCRLVTTADAPLDNVNIDVLLLVHYHMNRTAVTSFICELHCNNLGFHTPSLLHCQESKPALASCIANAVLSIFSR
jgi:hypothetical protein